MFERYPDKVLAEPTPERVMALLRTINMGVIDKSEISGGMTLSKFFGQPGSDVWGPLFRAVQELGFVQDSEGKAQLCLDAAGFSDYSALRRTVAGQVLNRPETTFFLISQRMLALNERILDLQNWKDLAVKISDDNYEFNEQSLLGWRWWGSYLGLGYLSGTTFLPNLYVRFGDVLSGENELPRGKDISAQNFILRLEALCPEIGASRNERTLGLGVSNGMRLLVNKGFVEMKNIRDAERWQLHHIEVHPLNEFTHVMLRSDKNGLA